MKKHWNMVGEPQIQDDGLKPMFRVKAFGKTVPKFLRYAGLTESEEYRPCNAD